LNNQIAITSRLLNSYRLYSEREKSTIEQLHNEQIRIENLVTQFKNNNEEYNKIKQASEEKVKRVLPNGKLLLKFATFSVIES
jgi:vancomycin permeability regulator SanA